MVNSICEHTNSYAQLCIFEGPHQACTQNDGSWKDVTPDEIKRVIAMLIYFGVVKVGGNVDRYWDTKTLLHGLWTRAVMPRLRFRAIIGLLHVVDPGAETPGDKLRKVETY